MGVILSYAILLLVIAMIACVVYLLVYQHVINKRLSRQKTDGKKLLSPGAFFIAALGVALLIFGIGTAVMYLSAGSSPDIDDKHLNATYDYTVHDSNNIQDSYAAGYSTEKNAGYERHEETVGDIKFIYFSSKDSFDIFHPSYIIFAEYIGNDTSVVSYGYDGSFLSNTGTKICSKGASGAVIQDSICITGSASLDCIFSLTIYLYNDSGMISMQNDKEQTSSNNSKYAVTYSTLDINVNSPQD